MEGKVTHNGQEIRKKSALVSNIEMVRQTVIGYTDIF